MLNDIWDYIVVGGGLAGSVLASQLYEKNTKLSILVVEAGADVSNNTIIPTGTNLIGSNLDWGYLTLPQTGLDNRILENPAGKALGGGTAINSCGWVRGDASDYDAWANLVGDARWSYRGMLPYMKKTEHNWNKNSTLSLNEIKQHGYNGPMWDASVSSTGRKYPLRDTIKAAWASAGIQVLPDYDANDGSPQGLGELVENRRDGLRQLASTVYPLNGVQVLTNTLVKRVLLAANHGKVSATGIELGNGTRFAAKKEVIISAGSYRTPQILLLSGVGPKDDLLAQGIKPVVNSPTVGGNLWDHLQLVQHWKLRNPSSGVAIGSNNSLFSEPQFGLGLPIDWIATSTVPIEGLKAAIQKDEGKPPTSSHPLLSKTRTFFESIVQYADFSGSDPTIPLDGSHIGTSLIGLQPTSRGMVKLNSTNIEDPPIIDPHYYTTEVDKFAMRTGMKTIANLMLNTPQGMALIESETVPDGFKPVLPTPLDEDLDTLLRATTGTSYHGAGTSAMGKVVDTNLKVIGVCNLRVVDASIIPVPIAAHLQIVTYALAQQAADIISGDHNVY